MARFSKEAMLNHIQDHIDALKINHGFKDGDGWRAVEGDDIQRIIAFGRFDALRDLQDDIYGGNVA